MESPNVESFSQVRRLIEDLFPIRPAVYWSDFLITMGVAWGSFGWMVLTPITAGVQKAALFTVCTLAFFRGLVFIHEIAHFSSNDLRGFRWAWNSLCGLIFFLPSFTYLAHSYHHRVSTFSTSQDLEYLPWAGLPALEIVLPLLIYPFLPVVMAVRFLVVGPISLVVGGRLREWLLRHASTLKMNPRFVWTPISAQDRRLAVQEEILCFTGWMIILLGCYGGHHWSIFRDWYLVSVVVMGINHIRSLARHRYGYTGDPVSFEAQVVDAVTITGVSPLADLLMPTGLRYHSVHHMFQSLPYHALRKAHQRLQQSLPKDHLYFKTLMPGFLPALFNVFKPVEFYGTEQSHRGGSYVSD
jgi:hypothetical protein